MCQAHDQSRPGPRPCGIQSLHRGRAPCALRSPTISAAYRFPTGGGRCSRTPGTSSLRVGSDCRSAIVPSGAASIAAPKRAQHEGPRSRRAPSHATYPCRMCKESVPRPTQNRILAWAIGGSRPFDETHPPGRQHHQIARGTVARQCHGRGPSGSDGPTFVQAGPPHPKRKSPRRVPRGPARRGLSF